MGTDWERMQGQGGAYLVERAAAVLQNGRLTPLAVALVEAEVEPLKFTLDEEISRLAPAGELTPAAIAALRTYYQGRLDAALNVIAAARSMAQTAPAVTAPTLPSPPSGGGTDARPTSGGGEEARRAFGGGQERSRRASLADRSILT